MYFWGLGPRFQIVFLGGLLGHLKSILTLIRESVSDWKRGFFGKGLRAAVLKGNGTMRASQGLCLVWSSPRAVLEGAEEWGRRSRIDFLIHHLDSPSKDFPRMCFHVVEKLELAWTQMRIVSLSSRNKIIYQFRSCLYYYCDYEQVRICCFQGRFDS